MKEGFQDIIKVDFVVSYPAISPIDLSGLHTFLKPRNFGEDQANEAIVRRNRGSKDDLEQILAIIIIGIQICHLLGEGARSAVSVELL